VAWARCSALDTRLNRDVTIKVLPDLFAHDPDRLARCEREAQILAGLNHPDIAHVHGLEESNGIRALVMELVEGMTLADIIGGMPGWAPRAVPTRASGRPRVSPHRDTPFDGDTATDVVAAVITREPDWVEAAVAAARSARLSAPAVSGEGSETPAARYR
jgi:hypothetical protein